MFIKTISLQNFRSHTTYHLDCDPTTNLILGENGCGKTSVLEGIYILTQGKSFRATDSEIIKRDAPFYRIELEYDSGIKTIAAYDGNKKTFEVADKKTTRLPSKHKYPIVLFLPSDLNLVGGSPSSRRNYFDRFFSTLSQEYNSALNKYEKALLQRNKLLKEEIIKNDALFPWNILLAQNAIVIKKLRQNYVEKINQSLNQTYHSIADNNDKVELEYATDLKDATESDFLELLEKNYEKDRIMGYTTIGIQRDNFDFIFNNKRADGSASRGETRSIILALKFIEANIIYDELKVRPIILLDDVFSELDNKRRRCLINNFKNHQVIITSVEKFTD